MTKSSRGMTGFPFAGVVAVAIATLSFRAALGAPPVQFNRDVRPILSQHCFKCHGPAVQESSLRLDRAEAATSALPSAARAVVPGDATASELLKRVTTEDAETRMPPASEGPSLSSAQIEVLRHWIAQGATYQPHWSYLPVTRPGLVAVKFTDWPRNAIDYFVLASIEAAGLTPAPEAPRETLIRRLSLDLTGLPPTPAEVAAFVADAGDDAYDRLVERLLASPQYGVRQALIWLDLARYADTDGYPADGDRTVWPYRDWVVNAFNADLPYDQFTIEQLAGDLLPGATTSQQIASAFHRQTRINREAGVDPEEFRIEAVMDRVNTTATVWLGSTLGCAQCHDHKFDPFTQRDYYRLLAYFNNTASETATDEAGRITDVSPRVEFTTDVVAARPVEVLVMRELAQPRETHLLLRGSFLTPGEQVTPGTPEFLTAAPPADGVDRLALTRWLVDKRNPLAARVAVNRVWAQYFGAGIIETLDDVGTQAPTPTHPELLDWLASEFMARDWHFKPLHRLIVQSATYRQSSATTADTRAGDPLNRLLARGPRLRLSAELVRDNALAIGGILSTELGGPSIGAEKMRTEAASGTPYRRSIFVNWRRQALDDVFLNFDAPSRDVACTRRTRTNTPLQALTLLNDRMFLDAARGLARRAQQDGGSNWDGQLNAAFRATLSRGPRESERLALSRLFERRSIAFAADPAGATKLLGATDNGSSTEDLARRAAWVLVASTLLNLNETITRE